MRRHLPLFLFLVIGACACSTGSETNSQAVKDTVLRYNQILAEAYARMNMNPLREVATADQAAKEYRHMAALGEARIRMESSLKSIKFSGMTFSGSDKASVVTRETWDYTHIDVRTGDPVKMQQDVSYALQYDLKKEAGRWRVVSVEAIDRK